MVRPGPKTRIEDVETAIIELLRGHPEGLNFNEIFRRLKERKLLGSFSVLSRAMQDLSESKIVIYRDLAQPRYKIPMRIYTLTPKTQSILENFVLPYSSRDIEVTEPVLTDLLADIKTPSEAAFLATSLHHALQLVLVYEQMIEENGDPKGLWRLLLKKIFDDERSSMEKMAQQARDHKIPMDFKQELSHSRKLLFKWADILTVYFISKSH